MHINAHIYSLVKNVHSDYNEHRFIFRGMLTVESKNK